MSMHDRRRFVSIAVLATGLALVGCGDGGGSDSTPQPPAAVSQNRVDVAVAGLPAGADAAVAISDSTGRVVATLTTTGSAVVAGPGTFTVTANPVVVGSLTYVAAVDTVAIDVPSPPSMSTVSVVYAAAPPLKLRFEAVATGLDAPTFLASPPGFADLYVVELPGRIRKLVNGVPQAPVVDITARVGSGGERGMLSLAFDPAFASNGYVYVCFTETSGDIAVERFTLPLPGNTGCALRRRGDGNARADDPPSLVCESQRRTTAVRCRRHAVSRHGGRRRWRRSTGQRPERRFAPRQDPSPGRAYAAVSDPPDNPFVGQPGRRGEIWAYGVRNPWRFAFDSATNSLYVADVGQGSREEVNVVAANAAGLNYGWNAWEGTMCYPSGNACSAAGVTMPVLDYDHANGCSITGGYVYRGARLPEVAGRYFYSDFCNGWLRSFLAVNGVATERLDWHITPIGSIQSFGVDSRNELYALTSGGGVYRLVRQ
jgi:glucose/arabinose dehydrogenase